MNTKFLDKVVDQILSETKFNFSHNIMLTPYSKHSGPRLPMNYLIIPYISSDSITYHCREVYSVGEHEMKYVIRKYKRKLYLKLRLECPKKYLIL